MLTVDELFLYTLDDLEQRVPLGRGRYDALQCAGLLRKLVFEEQPLITRVNATRNLKIRYLVTRPMPDTNGVDWFPSGSFYPDAALRDDASSALNLDEFRRHPIICCQGEVLMIKDLVRYMAHVGGAVHVRLPSTPAEKALSDYLWRMTISAPEGNLPGGIWDLVAVGKIVLAAVAPLRSVVAAETWPDGRPSPTTEYAPPQTPEEFRALVERMSTNQ